MRTHFYFMWLLIFILPANRVFPQCCTAGNPVGGDNEQGNMNKNILNISTLFKHSYSDTYFEDTEKSDHNYIDNSSFDFQSLGLAYGITKRLNIKLGVGYFYSKTQNFKKPVEYTRIAFGLGDGSVELKYLLYNNQKATLKILPSFVLKIPVGVFDQVVNHVMLPIDIQPSSGNFKYNSGIFIYKGISKKMALFSLNSIEIAQEIHSKRVESYKYGNLYMVSLFASYKLTKKASAVLQIRNEIREKSVDKGNIINATGGSVVIAAPQINYMLAGKWDVSVMFDMPIYKKVNGYQLTNKYAVTFGVSRKLELGKKNKQCTIDTANGDLAVMPELANLNEVTITVYGLCGMCKERIENAAKEVKQVVYANWDPRSKKLVIKYEGEINLDDVHNKLAKAGHDTDKVKADDKVYDKLPGCCRYRK